MADIKQRDRPLSPHLMIYRPLYTMLLSIMHRITGVGLTLGLLMVTWWFLAAAIGEEYFAYADAMLNSIIGGLILIASAWALSFHLCNGIRHLFWDAGFGFDLQTAWRSGMAVIAASIVLTVIVVIVAIGGH
ncbi:MAG: succinate dehydrogenase, cytochrome b556 subunit [Rhodobacteraceae bacterium]|nr:succinate dehydrogenase, cytochrome b556 subunit [Paracoccaceae bacterium]